MHRGDFGCGAVGVDIERCGRHSNVPSLELQIAFCRERQMDAGRQPGFFERWVAKEAGYPRRSVWAALQQLSWNSPQRATIALACTTLDLLAPVGRMATRCPAR